MKHMKRVTSFLLAVLLTLSLCVPALALTPKADKEIVKAGEDVNVTLTIDEAMSRISSMQACVYFDGDVFTYKSFTANKEEQMTIYNTDRTSDDGRTYRTIDYVSNGKGSFAAGDEFAVFTFTAKKDINVSKQANFSAYITFRGSLKEDNTPLEEDNVTVEKAVSVTVTPASTEPEGYAVAASAVNPSITVNDKAQVALEISNKDVKTYNAYYMEVSYDTSVLAYESIASTDAKVIDSNGTLKIVGYGADKTCGTDNIVLTFTGKATGEAKVTVTSAKVDVKGNADAKDAPNAQITTDVATITVGGYKVSLPDGFKGEGTANPDQDYTFTAKDLSKKYDFTGSTMGGKTVEVIDNGDGTYTVKNVSGELVIKATEKAGKVTINLSGDAVDTITQKSWGTATEVDAGTALWFMARPEPGKELVVTVNDEVVAGMNMQAFMRYNIAADKVTGTELNIVVSYKAADKATIIESGTAWDKVGNLSRKGWTQSGDKVDAGATLDFFFKPETGKTINDYVIRANGADCMYTKVGGRYKVTIPAEIITAGATVTINFDYAATPEPTITVDVSEYLKVNKQSIFLITAACDELTEGKMLAYDGNQMYWSAKYNESNGAYAWLVISDKSLEEVKTEAEAAITAVDGAKVEIAYNGDVNLTNAADINDAQLVWNMYNAEYSDFQQVSVRKFLEADMTADGKLDTADAAAIIALITK